MVTTQWRGVFFGYAEDTAGERIFLRRGRHCIHWEDTHGFMGLALEGPNGKCRIGPSADIELRGVTAVIEVSEEAARAWEAEPWNR